MKQGIIKGFKPNQLKAPKAKVPEEEEMPDAVEDGAAEAEAEAETEAEAEETAEKGTAKDEPAAVLE